MKKLVLEHIGEINFINYNKSNNYKMLLDLEFNHYGKWKAENGEIFLYLHSTGNYILIENNSSYKFYLFDLGTKKSFLIKSFELKTPDIFGFYKKLISDIVFEYEIIKEHYIRLFLKINNPTIRKILRERDFKTRIKPEILSLEKNIHVDYLRKIEKESLDEN